MILLKSFLRSHKSGTKSLSNIALKAFTAKTGDNVTFRNPFDKVKDPRTPEYNLPWRQYYQAIGIKPDEVERKAQSSYVAIERYGKIYHLFDASKYSYGRMCSKIAFHMQGKHRPNFKNNVLNEADIFVILNANNIKLTGRKRFYKKIRYHTGYVGHLVEKPIREFIENKPEQLIHYTISKMLPKNILRRSMIRNLHIYRGGEHEFKFLPHVIIPLNKFVAPKRESNPYVEQPSLEEIKKSGVVLYETNPGIDKDILKDVPRDIDENYGKRLSDQPTTMTTIPKKKLEKLRRMLKRYNRRKYEYVYKTKKHIDYQSGLEPFLINNEKMIKKHNLEHLFGDDPDKEEDYDSDDNEFKESDFR